MGIRPQPHPESRPRSRRPPDFAGRIFTGSDEATPPSALDGVLDEFTARWERGDSPRAEDYLGRLASDAPGDVVELVYHEYCLAESSGLAPDPSSFLVRFPEHRDRLGLLFGLHEAWDDSTLRDWTLPVSLPEAGDEVGPYRLLRVLGRGGFARVFLAEEADLDHRLVVLKVSTRASAEPRLLARARHSHIVEVLRHDHAEDGALHLVAMPFLGGATLAQVLAERQRRGGRAGSGRDLLRDLDSAGDPAFPVQGLARPAREILDGLSHAKAVAWIVARLAEALDHAQRHGVVHGDLKPANILLTADGHPLLFDFNLAVDWSRADPEGPSGEAGGTLAYMAPERLLALADPSEAPRPRAIERHQADLFALGLILRESLGGPPPAPAQGPGRLTKDQVLALRAARLREPLDAAWVPASLRPILARCLAPEPADRYGRAAELAEDLDRWRADLWPAFAAAPAWRFAPGRWVRRRRLVLVAALLTLAVGALAAVVVGRAYDGPLRASAIAKRDAAWAVVEPRVFRYRDGWQIKAEGDPVDSARHHLDAYDVLGSEDWHRRDDVRYLPEGDRQELEAWLMEQAWRYAAALEARHASGDDWRRALACLERASALAPSALLEAECRALRARLGLPGSTPRAIGTAPGWVEEYLLGVEAEPLHASLAFEHYLNVLRTRPESFWARYRAAGVACRLGDFHEGAAHLARCVRRFPANPALRTQLAACFNALGKPEAALEECERALALAPDFREAIRTRALILARLGQADGVRADLSRYEALSRRREPGSTWNLRLELRDFPVPGPSSPDRERALREALAADPEDTWVHYELARSLKDQGRPAECVAQCDAILAIDPDNLRAQFFRANVLAESGKDEARHAFQALIDHPRFEEFLQEYAGAIGAFHKLTRLLLEQGDVSGGLAVARDGLAQAERFQTLRGESHFRLACAYALAARTDARCVDQAANHLKLASGFHRDYRDRWFPREPLFDPVRPDLVRRLALP